jgi:hypothetical protein
MTSINFDRRIFRAMERIGTTRAKAVEMRDSTGPMAVGLIVNLSDQVELLQRDLTLLIEQGAAFPTEAGAAVANWVGMPETAGGSRTVTQFRSALQDVLAGADAFRTALDNYHSNTLDAITGTRMVTRTLTEVEVDGTLVPVGLSMRCLEWKGTLTATQADQIRGSAQLQALIDAMTVLPQA